MRYNVRNWLFQVHTFGSDGAINGSANTSFLAAANCCNCSLLPLPVVVSFMMLNAEMRDCCSYLGAVKGRDRRCWYHRTRHFTC